VHGNLDRLSCSDCGKMFTSKRSLFGHKKEKHSGQLGMDAILKWCGRCLLCLIQSGTGFAVLTVTYKKQAFLRFVLPFCSKTLYKIREKSMNNAREIFCNLSVFILEKNSFFEIPKK
jgi:hypothetical protein